MLKFLLSSLIKCGSQAVKTDSKENRNTSHFYVTSIETKVQMKVTLAFLQWGESSVGPLLNDVCMPVHKNYFSLLSVIFDNRVIAIGDLQFTKT